MEDILEEQHADIEIERATGLEVFEEENGDKGEEPADSADPSDLAEAAAPAEPAEPADDDEPAELDVAKLPEHLRFLSALDWTSLKEEMLPSWRSSMDDHIAAQAKADRALIVTEPRDNQIMLITARFDHGPSCLLVHWGTSFKERKGRRVRLDDRCRVIWNVPFAVPVEEFDVIEILVEDVRASMWRRGPPGREAVPDWVLLLWEAMRIQTFSLSLS